MSEKPQRRLVSKGHYARTLLDRTILFSVAGLVLLLGLLLLAIAVFSMNDVAGILFALIPGALGIAALAYSRRLFVEGKEIEPVRPLTRHNQHLSPPEETLVRASDQPASQQNAELLRAAQYSKETPAEELLRAGRGSRQVD